MLSLLPRGLPAVLAVSLPFLCAWFVGSPIAAPLETAADYKARIEQLEARIARLEAFLNAATETAPREKFKPEETVPAALTAAPEDEPVSGAVVESPPPQPNPARGPVSPEDDSALQELFVIREKAVALSRGKWEVATEFTYQRDDSFLQFSRGFGARASVHYGLLDGIEVSATIPFASTFRRTVGLNPIEREYMYVGDIALQANVALSGESAGFPGLVGTLGVTLPTGPAPYAPGPLAAGRNPNDPLSFYTDASGHYRAGAGLQAFKTFDPVVFFAGFSVDYPFRDQYGGIVVEPGLGFSYNAGTSFAVSEHTTFGYTLVGQHRENLKAGGVEIAASGSEPLFSKFSLIHRLAPGVYLEPSVSLGMTQDAADAIVTVGARARF